MDIANNAPVAGPNLALASEANRLETGRPAG